MSIKFKDLFRSRGSRSQSLLSTSFSLTLESFSLQVVVSLDSLAQSSQTIISSSLIIINTHDSSAIIEEGQNYDVQVLYDSDTKTSVDIVFVHELTDDAYNIWLHKNTRVH